MILKLTKQKLIALCLSQGAKNHWLTYKSMHKYLSNFEVRVFVEHFNLFDKIANSDNQLYESQFL